MRAGCVEVEPLRAAFLASGATAYEVARRLGWSAAPALRAQGHDWDSQRVRRRLGLCAYTQRGGRPPKAQRHMTHDTAALLAEAIGVDPIDVGI